MKNLKLAVLLSLLYLGSCAPDDDPYFDLTKEGNKEITALMGDTITIYGENFIQSFKPSGRLNISIFHGNKIKIDDWDFRNEYRIIEIEDNYMTLVVPVDAILIGRRRQLVIERYVNQEREIIHPDIIVDIPTPKILGLSQKVISKKDSTILFMEDFNKFYLPFVDIKHDYIHSSKQYFFSKWNHIDNDGIVLYSPQGGSTFSSQVYMEFFDPYITYITPPLFTLKSEDFIKKVNLVSIIKPDKFANGSTVLFSERSGNMNIENFHIDNNPLKYLYEYPGEGTYVELPSQMSINSKYKISVNEESFFRMENEDLEIEIEEAYFRVLDDLVNSNNEFNFEITHLYDFRSLKLGLISADMDTLWQDSPFRGSFETEVNYGRIARIASTVPAGEYKVVLCTRDKNYFIKPAGNHHVIVP